MKRIRVLLLIALLCRCQSTRSSTNWQPTNPYEQKFAVWEVDVRDQRRSGFDRPDPPDLTSFLADKAHEHVPFLRERLKENAAVMLILNGSQTLRKRRRPPETLEEMIEVRQGWLEALDEWMHNNPSEATGAGE